MIKMENLKLKVFSLQKHNSLNYQLKSRLSTQKHPFRIEKAKQKIIQPLSKNISVLFKKYKSVQQILEWRRKTQFPIVKVKNWKNTSISTDTENSHINFNVELESQLKNLSQIDHVSFIQAVYILKESLIGFDRLCYRFGMFNPTKDMIFFDKNGNCKVWIHQNQLENYCQFPCQLPQKEFIKTLCSIIKQKSHKSAKSFSFFEAVQESSCFFQAIASIRNFIKENNMQIPNSLKFNFELQQKRRLQKQRSSQKISIKIIEPSKAPSFLKRTESKSKLIYKALKRNDVSMPQLRIFLKNQRKTYASNTTKGQKHKFSKSPSHQMIGIIENKNQENLKQGRTTEFGQQAVVSENHIHEDCKVEKQSNDTNETSVEIKVKQKHSKKLSQMGRFIIESEETNGCEFQLEFGQKILNEEFIRKQFSNLLS